MIVKSKLERLENVLRADQAAGQHRKMRVHEFSLNKRCLSPLNPYRAAVCTRKSHNNFPAECELVVLMPEFTKKK